MEKQKEIRLFKVSDDGKYLMLNIQNPFFLMLCKQNKDNNTFDEIVEIKDLYELVSKCMPICSGIKLDNNFFNKVFPEKEVDVSKDLFVLKNENGEVVAMTYNKLPIINEMMGYVRETAKACCPPQDFIDAILRHEAFNVACASEQWETAIKWYKEFILNKSKGFDYKRCNCE